LAPDNAAGVATVEIKQRALGALVCRTLNSYS